MRVPTEKQTRNLLFLASGSALVVPPSSSPRSIYGQLQRHGWIAPTIGDGFLRMTPDGYRALALAVERHGLPELKR